MALLQTTVMLVSVPFGYIGGLLSDISRILPFILSITLLLLGMLATALFYQKSSGQKLSKRKLVVTNIE
jgi:ABC-type glucose/galactose transport system permease subunit